MTTLRLLENWLSPALVRALGYALLHSLWQGAVLAGLLAALPLLRRHRPEVRYAASAATLAGLLLAVGGTFGYYYWQAPAAPVAMKLVVKPLPAPASPAALQPTAPARPLALLPRLARQAEPYLPLLVAAWLLGLLLMGGRLAGGLLYAGRLRRVGTQALGAEWQRRLAALAARAGLRRPVALLKSARVRGPLVLGYLRPAILLPLGVVAGLPPALLEALLAHELAHIVRRDYLLNLALAATEVLFFYHPAVWLMAASLRAERENCCDDQAAALCGGDRLRVARALAALAELEAVLPAPRLALAATGSGGRGTLLARVRRLALGHGQPQAPTLREGLLAGLLCLLGVAGLGTGLAVAAPAAKPSASPRQTTPADTTRRKAPAVPAAPLAPPLPDLSAAPAIPAVPAVPAMPLDTPRQRAVGKVRVDADENVGVRRSSGLRRTASTVVLEKDKKGRVVSLTVDGQPVATGETGKKAKHGKTTSTVEIIEPAAPPVPSAPSLRAQVWRDLAPGSFNTGPGAFSFRFPDEAERAAHDRALADARENLAKSLRDPKLTDRERRAIEQAQRSLDGSALASPRTYTYRLDGKANGLKRITPSRQQELHFDLNGTALGSGFSRSQIEQLAGPGVGAITLGDGDSRSQLQQSAQTQRELHQAQREMQQYQLEMQRLQREMAQTQQKMRLGSQQAQRELNRGFTRLHFDLQNGSGDDARTATRRAQLEARIAAAEAELQTLDRDASKEAGASGRGLRTPAAPRAPLAPAAPGQTAPLPPPPPGPPSSYLDLRKELRSDGLIGASDRSFNFELNNQGGRVNGRALTAEQVAKYRSLLGRQADRGKSNFRLERFEIKEN